MKPLTLAEFAALPASASVLYFDTETTGKADWRAPASALHQPRVVQIGAELHRADTCLAMFHTLVQPAGWTIPAEATAIHGITDAMCAADGLPGLAVLNVFVGLLLAADVVVSFNLDFDALMLEIEGHHHQRPDLWRDVRGFCAMRAATPYCRLPGHRPGQYKWPRLAEAHQILCGTPLVGAHGALADTRGCRNVTQALCQRQRQNLNPQP
jgi:DNA polymerase III epsilon subunit-like protein